MGSHRVEHVYACVHVYTRFVQLIRLEVTRHDREQPVTSFSLEYLHQRIRQFFLCPLKVSVALSCLTLCDPKDFSRPEYWSG